MYDRGKTKIMLLLKTENIQICFMFDLHVLTHYHKNYFFFLIERPAFTPLPRLDSSPAGVGVRWFFSLVCRWFPAA